MDALYFIVRYIPFWAVPVMIICGEFGYIYWLKNRRRVSAFLMTLTFLSVLALIWYLFIGGSEGAVEFVYRWSDNVKRY